MAFGKLDIQKKQHRERGQLQKRARLGLLEKHKDYVKRARDYHLKQDRLKRLQQKASSRNKDELYFGMIRSQTERGRHLQQRRSAFMSTDVVRLLKTQDVGYIRTLRLIEEKRVARMQADIGAVVPSHVANILDDMLEDGSKVAGTDGNGNGKPNRRPQRVVFVDSSNDTILGNGRPESAKRQSDLIAKQEDGFVVEQSSARSGPDLFKSRLERLKRLREAERLAEIKKNALSKGARRHRRGSSATQQGMRRVDSSDGDGPSVPDVVEHETPRPRKHLIWKTERRR